MHNLQIKDVYYVLSLSFAKETTTKEDTSAIQPVVLVHY